MTLLMVYTLLGSQTLQNLTDKLSITIVIYNSKISRFYHVNASLDKGILFLES
ncbi:hypothetical protein NMYAN_210024 [Nitrosomonas nitrosa]|uniref:Uncharacterized protein n=1 Tax=Nitrosomonas nitrosa TaxID=52442 RepID=A0A8H8YZZ8_9PROT|nr:hypothetical protein NMYAN_210024 [Nitrosomonas nitrosa]